MPRISICLTESYNKIMGSLTSRQNAGVEEVDIVSNHAYKYPPRSGQYNIHVFFWFSIND